MDCFAIHLFFFSNRREAKKGCREQVPCWGLGIGVTRPLCGIQRDGNRKSQGSLARSRSGRVCRRQRTAPPCEFPGSKPHRSPSMDCIAIHLLSPFFKPPRSAERVQGTMFPAGVWGDAPSLPLDGLLCNPSALSFFKPPRSGDGSLRDNRPSGGVWGGSPITPPSSPVPRPRHSMRTFRPSIIAARALRENASNCLSVMCSIRLSGFTEPAAVVLAVGTP